MDQFSIHGGRLGEARLRFPDAPKPWVDLSTGVNPSPYPAHSAGAAVRARLPDPRDLQTLETVAGAAFGVSGACVLATAGAEAALRLLASMLPLRRVGVIAPTYGGYAAAWAATGAQVTGFARDGLERAAADCDLLVLANPNNPDGALWSPDSLLTLAGRMTAKNGWLIVDEAFAEVTPRTGLTASLGRDVASARLVVLRSFGKFYGLPGLRLGFALAAPGLIAQLRHRLGEWPLSADAIAAGLQAYADPPWTEATLRRLDQDAARLDALLSGAGFEIVGGTSLFRLAAVDDAEQRFARLAQAGVLTRPFRDNPRWLRFGLPAPEHWSRLEAALMESAR